jgi:hypothetical protein
MILGNLEKRERVKNIIESLNNGLIILYGPEGIGKKSFLLEYLKKKGEKYILISDEDDHGIGLSRILKITSYQNHKEKFFVLIDNAHKLTKEAQNALLKSLEEPLGKIIFIMITHRLGSILSTIRSRGILIPFHVLKKEETLDILKKRGLDLSKYKLLLEIYPGQPGKIINLLKKLNIDKLIKFFESPSKIEKLLLIEELTSQFNLGEILEIYLLLLRKEILRSYQRKSLDICYKTLSLWLESESSSWPLNKNLQLTNLILNQ